MSVPEPPGRASLFPEETMAAAKEIKADIKAAKKIWLPWWAVLSLIIATICVLWLFDHFGRLNLGLPTMNSMAVVAFAIAVKWKLKRYVWFWGTMAIIAALHILLLLSVPWPDKWVPAVAIAAIDSADLIVIFTILAAVRRSLKAPKTTER